MKAYILKATTLAGLLLSEAWFINSPDWEPLITFIALLGALLGEEVYYVRRKPSTRDRELANLFLEEFPSSGAACTFLSTHDIAVPFPGRKLREIENFKELWSTAEREFIDKAVDAQRKELLRLSDAYLRALGGVTDDPGNNGVLTIGVKDWDNSPEIMELRDQLNRMGNELFKAHQEMVRVISKRILA